MAMGWTPSVSTTPSTGSFSSGTRTTRGVADLTFRYGPKGAGLIPVAGDWNNDEVDTIGLYDPIHGVFFLRNTNDKGVADLTFRYGSKGTGLIPVAGDWNSDGVDTIGLYDPIHGAFFLRNSNNSGVADLTFRYGPKGAGLLPMAGDWNNNGVDTIGLYNPATGVFFLRNSNDSGVADLTFRYGPKGVGLLPMAGDWDGNGLDTIALYNPGTGVFFLRDSNDRGVADLAFRYGPGAAGLLPLPGGTTFVLLVGATTYTGTYPAPEMVSFTDPDGLLVEVTAHPGQILVFFDPSTPPADAEALIKANGGTVLEKVPVTGYYFVGVVPGEEDTFISAITTDSRVDLALPHVAASFRSAGITVIDGFTNDCEGPHALLVVGSVTNKEGILDQSTPCRSMLDSFGKPSFQIALEEFYREAGEKSGGENLINMSWGGEQPFFDGEYPDVNDTLKDLYEDDWTNALRLQLAAISHLPERDRENLVVTIAAGNGNMPLTELLAEIRKDVKLAGILKKNVLIVGASDSVYSDSDDAPGDPDFANMTDVTCPDMTNATSCGAPKALVIIQKIVLQTGLSPTLVLLAAKLAVAANANGELIETEALSKVQGILEVTPGTGLSMSGPEGGPFSPPSQTYTLTNSGASTINFTISKSASWVSLSKTSGTLAPGASTTVLVAVNSNAAFLSPATYSDTVSFTNTTNGTGNTSRSVTLLVEAPATQVFAGSFNVTGSFTNVSGGCMFSVNFQGTITITLTVNTSGAVSGPAVVTGSWLSTPTSNGGCASSSGSLDNTVSVSGTTSNITFQSVTAPVLTFNGSLNNTATAITGTATFTFANTTGQAATSVTLNKQP